MVETNRYVNYLMFKRFKIVSTNTIKMFKTESFSNSLYALNKFYLYEISIFDFLNNLNRLAQNNTMIWRKKTRDWVFIGFLLKKNTRFRIIGFICEFGGEWREELWKKKRNEQVEEIEDFKMGGVWGFIFLHNIKSK